VFITQVLKMSMLVKSDTAPLQAKCPRCSESLTLPQGKSSCHNCNLQFKLMFESPNCRNCGYDVTQTNNNLCPECGEPIGTSSTS
jgi:predicted amidophosphoribosyltransferase